jgi:aspartate carbamoyltransferase catalytic subunit
MGGLEKKPGRSCMSLKHVVESQQFTVPLLMELFERARSMERVVARGGTLDYQNRIMASLFYQPSTRTRFSFEAAMHRLGGRVLSTEHARAFSSEIEAEQVEDSIRIISSYCDVIVIRHHETGGAARAAKVSQVPIINAGDGDGGQHPTQALLDLYTIYRERPLDGLSVAFIGELESGRTVRSLAYLLAKFERVKVFFVAPPELQMKNDILQYLDRHGVHYEMESDIDWCGGPGGRGVPDPHPSRSPAPRPRCDTLRRQFQRAATHEARRHDSASPAAHGGAGQNCGRRSARTLLSPGR